MGAILTNIDVSVLMFEQDLTWQAAASLSVTIIAGGGAALWVVAQGIKALISAVGYAVTMATMTREERLIYFSRSWKERITK